jgi:hypothetical protein
MKMKWILPLPVLGLGIWAIMATAAPHHEGLTTKEFMREKLSHSQKALEALALEDFSTLAQQSKKLSAMTQEATWQVFQNPDYAQHSATFRRHANALTKAAQDKNLDAATLAYVRLTMSCVDCHKFVRGKVVAASGTEWQTVLARQ